MALLLCLAPCAASNALAASADALEKKLLPSVVYLQFWTEATKEAATCAGNSTGFIIKDPSNRKRILTTAHSLAPTNYGRAITSVKYRLHNDSSWTRFCSDALVDESHDLAVLTPASPNDLVGEPLEFHKDDKFVERELFALGSANSLAVRLLKELSKAEVITIKSMAKRLAIPPESFKLQGDRTAALDYNLKMVRHGIPVAPGYSGCPVVTDDGKVVGIQSSTLENAPIVGFAIHYSHLDTFDWRRPGRKLRDFKFESQTASVVLKPMSAPHTVFRTEGAKSKSSLSATIILEGLKVEAPLIHEGYVEESDAFVVIKKYIHDKEWYFQEEFGGIRILRLQQLLRRTRLARITNPTLGFQMLVPEGYRYSVQSTTAPDGMLLTFMPQLDRKTDPPYDWPVSMWVTVEPKMFVDGRASFNNELKTGKIELTEDQRISPVLFDAFRRRWVSATVADAVGPRFALRDLDLRIKDVDKNDVVSYRGNPGAEAFTKYARGKGAWLRDVYVSETTPLGHIVRIGTREPLVAIVHTQYSIKKALLFNNPDVDADDLDAEFILLVSSFSTAR